MGSTTAWILPAVLLALTLTTSAQKYDLDIPADYCKDMPLGGYKRHPYDCSRYVSCWSPKSLFLQACQPGLLYDERAQVCNYASLVQCSTSARPSIHSPTRSPAHSPARSRNNFVKVTRTSHRRPVQRPEASASTGGSPRVNTRGMIHNVHVQDMSRFIKVVAPLPPRSPVRFAAPRSRVRNSKPVCGHDGLYPDRANCTRYYICSYNHPYMFNCPLGTYFHPVTHRCEFKSDFGSDPCAGQTEQRRNKPRARQSPAPPRRPTARPTKTADMMSMVAGFMGEAKEMANKMVTKAVKMEAMTAGGSAGQKAFSGVAHFLGSDKTIKKMSLGAERQLETLKIIKNKFDLSNDEIKVVMKKMHSTLRNNPSRVSPDTPRTRVKMDVDTCPYPDEERRSRCQRSSKYRTMDGSCNNIKHPLWGRSMTPLTRFIDPDYCDNIGCPRRGRNNSTLPGPRLVSRTLFTSKPSQSHVHTVMLMTAGQFIDHDLTKTALSMISSDAAGSRSRGGGRLSDVTCGSDGCSTEGEENRACLPIEIPRGDPAFGSQKCLMFVRTQEVPQLDCQLGPRQQLNQLTHYMDASMIYGSTKEDSEAIRGKDTKRGKMMMTRNPDPHYKPLLPKTDNDDCRGTNSTIRCFMAGDERVNENVPLTGLHVVFARCHNYIEEELHNLNPRWGGERLYHETRKIMGAMWQHITYNEYLPIILGPQAMSRYGLTLQRHGFSNAYDPSVSVDIGNVFATAAFRFSHSMIPDTVVFSDKNYQERESKPLSTALRRPYDVYNNAHTQGSAVDSIMHGVMSQGAMRVDRHFTKQVTEHLFAENPPHGPGTDLAAINIQRGRDHGLPSYNEWRKWCSLRVARNFDDLIDLPVEDRRTLKRIYNHVDDIDIFAASVCEKNVPGGMVGPTFACILGRQFRNTKVGDRFWYENRDSTVGFTRDQLSEIRKITLSKLVCKASDEDQSKATAQRYAMLRPISEAFKELGGQNYGEVYSLVSLYHGEQNERKPCSTLPDLDLSKWRE